MNNDNWCSTQRLPDGTEVRIECFTQADLEAIYAIEKRAHAFPWRFSHFQDSLSAGHHHCIGIRVKDLWVGYAIVSDIAGEAELLLLVVDRPWQGRGVAQLLLSHVFRCLTGRADTLFLEVGASNERAIALYERLEFNHVGERPNYYRSGGASEDALIYARVLGNL